MAKNYCNNIVYQNRVLNKVFFDGGYLTPTGTPSSYRYYVKDHLDSNRILANSNGAVQQATHYYPYGGIGFAIGNCGRYYGLSVRPVAK